ncbi:MAG: helix-turn-helix domain-containing protein [Alphaproteobacteria bacterium]|nr:helix-turn-helix domain-containing protein [Alphaproteobacteria bacterium]
MVRDLIEKAIRIVGSEAKLGAAAGGYSQNAIWQAKRRGTITPELAAGIDRATNGAVRKSDLRPDIWPHEERVAS